ncbi:AAA family ATPase [Kitasatospora sp. NPDC097605]|uniref:AAA family ATPase n=1 Tax=Kitasatospora sp. NPDC097605 TaxID=3157226 RepID=UPI0033255F53
MPKLHIITGAPGAGKSTLLRHLGAYPFGCADFDELPEPDGRLLGVDITSPPASPVWPAYNRLWVRIAAMMLRAGGPVVILCPLTPGEWQDASGDAVEPPRAVWARLDCADADRRDRLAARGWDPDRIEDAVKDAEELRCMVEREFTTTGRSPAEVAAAVAAWTTDGSE